MGIGTDVMKQLLAAVAGTPEARAEIADAVNLGNEGLLAIDLADVDAKHVFAASKPAEYELVRSAEVAKRLDVVINPPKAENIEAAVEAEVAKR